MPDGRLLYTLNNQIFVMDADGSGKRQLTDNNGINDLALMMSDGRNSESSI